MYCENLDSIIIGSNLWGISGCRFPGFLYLPLQILNLYRARLFNKVEIIIGVELMNNSAFFYFS